MIKRIIMLLLMMVLVKIAIANPNPIGSQAWHDWNGMANAEWERMNRERAAQNSNAPVRQVKDNRKIWAVFIYNDETGDYFYDIANDFSLNHKNLLTKAKKTLKHYTGVEANKVLYWKDVYATIVMGKNKKTDKWETIMDNDMKTWKKYFNQGYDENNVFDALEADMLKKCSKKLDKCFVVVNLKKIFEVSNANKNNQK